MAYFSRVKAVRQKLGQTQQQFADEGFAPSVGWVRDQEQGREGRSLNWMAEVWMTVVDLDPAFARQVVEQVRFRRSKGNA